MVVAPEHGAEEASSGVSLAARTTIRADETRREPEASGQWTGLEALDTFRPRELVPGEQLGEGGMGRIVSAEQRSLRRDVAVKSLLDEHARDARSVESFVREAWVTGWLGHPNIPSIHALGLDPAGRPTLVMEQIRGETWESRIDGPRDGTLGELDDDDLRVFEQVCHAVEYAHSRGVLHRDIKPANVMIGAFGEVYLLDWGLSVALSDEAAARVPRARLTKGVSGTPAYMAPEMARGDGPALTERTDVYLLGATLYEVVLGMPPHRGRNVADTLRKAATDVPVYLPEEIAADLRAILARALAPKARERFESVRDLRVAVAAHRSNREARRLVQEADAAAAHIADAELTEASSHYHAARFGYAMAARVAPDEPSVRDGIARCVEAMARRYVEHEDARAALALLDEVELPDSSLRAEAEAVLARRADAEAELEVLREVARSVDLGAGSAMRVRAFSLVGVVWGGLAYGAGRLVQQGRLVLNYEDRYPFVVVVLGLLGIAFLVYREEINADSINRRLTEVAGMIGVTVLVNAAACDTLGVPVASSLVLEMVFTQFVLTIFGIFLHRGLLAAAIVHAPFLVLAMLVPMRTMEWLGIAVFLANATMAIAEFRFLRAARARA